MQRNRPGWTLAVGVAVIAAFNAAAALSMPERAWRPGGAATALLTALLAAHAALYACGDRVRRRVGTGGYVAAQAALVVVVTARGLLAPVALGLDVALAAETLVLAGRRWGTVRITLGTILLSTAGAAAASGVYRAAHTGVVLAAAAVVAQAVRALVQHGRVRPADVDVPARTAVPTEMGPPVRVAPPAFDSTRTMSGRLEGLTPREREVLRALAGGERSTEIAARLGIAERTVKAHLTSIYQKLGVATRTAAVAEALRRGLS